MRLHGIAAAVVAAAFCSLTAQVRAEVRPVSAAEREAVRIAADYLARGPQAVIDVLASNAPLRNTRDLAAEIETRLGPPAGSRWELQTVVPALSDRAAVFTIEYPSGIDETVTFELEPGSHRVRDLRILAQRTRRQPLFPPSTVAAAAGHTVAMPRRVAMAAVLVAFALALGAATFLRRSRTAARAMLGTAVAVVAAAAAYVIPNDELFTPPPVEQTVAGRPAPDESLAVLLPMRRALASSGDVNEIYKHVPHLNSVGDVARLWKAQADLQQNNVEGVTAALNATKNRSEIPLAAVLRGRQALVLNDDTTSVMAYEEAVNLGPGRDSLWYETADALMALGFDDRAAKYLQRLEKIGSRDASVYYALSLLSASKNREEDAAKRMRAAWTMRPIEREDVVATTPFWPILRSETVRSPVNVSAAAEAVVAPECRTLSPIAVPPAAQARISGTFLHLQIGEQELHVPGGACIAPAGTAVVDAGVWALDEEERGLRDVPALMTAARSASAFAQPALRQKITRAADALASRNRWAELAQLTDGLSPRAEHVPADVLFLRETALRRLDRDQEAKELLAGLAGSKVLQRKRDPEALETLAEKLANFDYFDAAIRMYDKAQAIRPNPYTDDRVRQIQMNKQLATRYTIHQTEHFAVHYPEDVSSGTADTIGRILETEHARLLKWTGEPLKERMVVNVVWWREFRATYTGNDFIAGFYTGKITVPLAGVVEFSPPIVALLSHELCHAMLAQATRDQAPRWFQEGLAQRTEVKEHAANAYGLYDDDKLIALSLLDATLQGSPYPAVIMEAYAQAETTLHFVEARYGLAGVKKMINAYRDGATTADAIRAVSGKSIAEFDGDLRAWGRTAPALKGAPAPAPTHETVDIRWSRRTK